MRDLNHHTMVGDERCTMHFAPLLLLHRHGDNCYCYRGHNTRMQRTVLEDDDDEEPMSTHDHSLQQVAETVFHNEVERFDSTHPVTVKTSSVPERVCVCECKGKDH